MANGVRWSRMKPAENSENASNMADMKFQIQSLTSQLNQLTTSVQRIESKIDQLSSAIKTSPLSSNTVQVNSSVGHNETSSKVTPTNRASGIPSKTNYSVVNGNGVQASNDPKSNRPIVAINPINAAVQNGISSPTETQSSKVFAARKMFEDLHRGQSKSVNDLPKISNPVKKAAEPMISIENRNSAVNLNKSFDESRSSTPSLKAPPSPGPTVTQNNSPSNNGEAKSTIINFAVAGRKISSATEIKRLQMLEQLKATIGERKVE